MTQTCLPFLTDVCLFLVSVILLIIAFPAIIAILKAFWIALLAAQICWQGIAALFGLIMMLLYRIGKNRTPPLKK